jgi:hypothetical protein
LMQVADYWSATSLPTITKAVAEYDWKKDLQPGALHNLVRLLFHANRVGREVGRPIIAALAALNHSDLNALLFDPAKERRLSDVTRLLACCGDPSFRRSVVERLDGRWMEDWMQKPDAVELRTLLYYCRDVRPEPLRAWFLHLPHEYVESLVRAAPLYEAMWIVWGIASLIPDRGKGWLSCVMNGENHADQWASADWSTQYAFYGMQRIITNRVPPARAFELTSPWRIAAGMKDLSGPATYSLCACGAFSSMPISERRLFARMFERPRLDHEETAMLALCAPEFRAVFRQIFKEIRMCARAHGAPIPPPAAPAP